MPLCGGMEINVKFRKLTLGTLGTNCYIAGDGDTVAVIDPEADGGAIMKIIEDENLTAGVILLTHGHYDHVSAASEIREKTGAKIYIHSLDAPLLSDNDRNLSFLTGEKITPFEADVLLEGGETINFGENSFTVLHTPGHSRGGVSYIDSECVFSGDLIFRQSIGRYDFGDYMEELSSIKKLISILDDDTLICPGHGPITTVGAEKAQNPYIKGLL